jgi:anti-sigma B factor antagonist
MEITQTEINGVTVLALTGRLDGVTSHAVEQKIAGILAGGTERLVFDCSHVDYASSAGLRVFLSTAKKLQKLGGRCAFAALTPELREIFRVSGFLDVLEIHDNVAASTV